MKQDHDYYIDNEEIAEVLARYDEMVKKNATYYFDIHEFVGIIQYFQDEGKAYNAKQAVMLALRLHPENTELKLLNAQVLFDLGNTKKALSILNEIEALEPDNSELFVLKGTIYALSGKNELAEKEFEKAINLEDTNLADTLYAISIAYEHAGNFQDAVKYLHRSYEISNNADYIVYDLAYCYEKTGAFDKSAFYYQKYLDNNPYSENAWYNLGCVFNALEDYKKAIDAFEFAVAIDEEFLNGLFNMANAYANMENYEKAIEIYKEALAVDSESKHVHYYLGECFEKIDRYEDAREAYNRTLELDAEFADAWFGLGILSLYAEELHECIYYIQKAIRIDNKNAEFWFVSGNVHAKLGAIEDAETAYKTALSIDPDDEECWLNYADLYSGTDIEKSISILNDGIIQIPGSTLLYSHISGYYFKEKKLQDCYLTLRMGMRFNKESHLILFEHYPEASKDQEILKMIESDSK